MGRKHISRVYPVIETGDMSAQIISKTTVVEQFDTVSYFISWVGLTLTGEFFIEVSNEEQEQDSVWKVLDFGVPLEVADDIADHQILIKDIHFKRIRLRYEAATGTGAIEAEIKSTTKGA